MTQTFLVPLRTTSVPNSREPWSVRSARVRTEREAVAWVLKTAVSPLSAPCSVHLTRIAPRVLDDDNLRGALKATRDEVAVALGVDDRDPMVRWEYSQERGRPRDYSVRIVIAA